MVRFCNAAWLSRCLVVLGIVVALAAAGWVRSAAAQEDPEQKERTPAQQALIDQLHAKHPDARVRTKLLWNKFCPITGKVIGDDPVPIAVRQTGTVYSIYSIAEPGLIEKFEAEHGEAAAKELTGKAMNAAKMNVVLDINTEGNKVTIGFKRLDLPADQRTPLPEPKDVKVELTVDASQKYQTIDGFGTATYAYSRANHEQYADPAFQKLIAEDLGMSIVRFPVVPAFFEEVANPEDITREKFMFDGPVENAPKNPKSGIPLAKTTKGVIPCLEFCKALVELNPEVRVVGSVWSPPHWMKTNNNQRRGGHLKPEYYRHFAKYLVEWVLHVKEEYGIDMYAIGPQNELAFREPYDSCVYTPEEYAALLPIIGEEFGKAGLETKIFGPEDMTKHLDRTMSYVRAVEESPAASAVLDIIATHGYSDGIESTGSLAESSEFWNAIKDYGKPHWMTETGPQAADNRWVDGGPDGRTVAYDNQGVPQGLEPGAMSAVGGRLHYALVYGNTSGWIFWQITSDRMTVHALMTDGQPDNKYYAAKHFWRWIRPGAVRIHAGPDGGEDGVCVSAYQHEENKTVTVVLMNRSHDNAEIAFDLKTDVPVTSFEVFRSTETEHCAKQAPVAVAGGKFTLRMPPRSMVTLYGGGE